MDEGNEGNEDLEWTLPVSASAPGLSSEPEAQREELSDPPPDDDMELPPSAGMPGAEPATLARKRTVLVTVLSVLIVLALVAAGLAIAHITEHGKTATRTSTTTSSTGPTKKTTTTTTLQPDTTAEITQLLDPAVVDVNSVTQLPTGYADSAGTGMIVSPDGYIVTNNHVVENASSITVSIELHHGSITAHFVGADPVADIAVIKVDGLKGLPTVHFGDSSGLGVGAPVVAIGNALGLGGIPTVTTGKVLALDRSITASDKLSFPPEHLTGMIQADAKIQPGNSGGPLVDLQAQVIGMNTAADSGSASSGYALPINRVAQIAKLIEEGRASPDVLVGLQACLGLYVKDLNGGLEVSRIIFGFPAATAGVEPGDFILAFDGVTPKSADSLRSLVVERRPGDAATVTFQSPFGTQTVSLRLVSGPAR